MIRLVDVHKSFGDLVVLDGVSLDFEMGATTAIIGPSGTGKSVLFKHLVGLLRPDSGKVECFGVDMATAPESDLFSVRRRFGMLFQDGALFDSMSVGDNIAFPLVHNRPDMNERARAERVAEVLEQVELPGIEDRRVSELSGGQRKRVGFARAIAAQPEVVLFDEPNSGLDPMTSDAIDELIVRMKATLGITFLVISHDIVGTLRVADHIGMLYGGKLIAYGTTAEVVRSEHPMVRRFLKRNIHLPDDDGPPELPRL
ncbi:MAG: ATP-binding cassette domain-containing protein [Proteobacteria bacterium]|nr:ATP-binding cassette domain-containing protein [Pseudomonadota bacterium]MCP4918788.1 ATP-binding cassette domain-containing protein [Pseudomonadota bacterium]